MKLTDRQKQVLLGVLRDGKRRAAATNLNREDVMERCYSEDARRGYVRLAMGRWCGLAGSNSNYVKASRTIAQLVRKNLVTKHSVSFCRIDEPTEWDTQTTHLKLTELGRRTAEELEVASDG